MDDTLPDGDTLSVGDTTISNTNPDINIILLQELRELKTQLTIQSQKQEARDHDLTETIKLIQAGILNLSIEHATLQTEVKTLRPLIENNTIKIFNLENENKKLLQELENFKKFESNTSSSLVENITKTKKTNPQSSQTTDLTEITQAFIDEKNNFKLENPNKIIVLYGLNEHKHETEYDLHDRIIKIFFVIVGVDLSGYVEEVGRTGRYGLSRPVKLELLSKRMTKCIFDDTRNFKNTGLWISAYLDKIGLLQRKKESETYRLSRHQSTSKTLNIPEHNTIEKKVNPTKSQLKQPKLP